MTPTDVIMGQLDWANKNICNNIDFIPEEKMSWKPEPTAKSPFEIIAHMAGTVDMMTAGCKGGETQQLPTPTTREEAKMLVSQVINAHVAYMKSLSPEDMKTTAKLPIGEFPMGVALGLPVIETVNHHGQLTYIETLMGDTESHLLLK